MLVLEISITKKQMLPFGMKIKRLPSEGKTGHFCVAENRKFLRNVDRVVINLDKISSAIV